MTTTERMTDRLSVALAGTSALVASVDADSVSIEGSPKAGRRIEVYVRDASDFDVRFHIPEKKGSPFELLIAGNIEEAEEVQRSVARFVADLVAERQILIMDTRGRQFIAVSDVGSLARHISWVVSWCGTYDSDATAA